ncbi:ankyrin repeat domain-containing protein 53 [Lates calcarifer]|uniref:Ankyrin repeat domain-containing protein 53 n=1 Tax=Lates calcarifer TaxID=8187 RepID=A0A4W6D7K7_LATCA|nr:ankyrin repeat domain-containing protein 53 [Lates calcarifer]
MEPVNKSGKGSRGRCKNRKLSRRAPPDGRRLPAVVVGTTRRLDVGVNRQGLPALHVACLYGQMATVQLLVESTLDWMDISDPQGRRPIHMVMSSQSSPNTSACLRYLLEKGADINVTTDSGQTPLHLAASEGLLDCVEILLQAGADVFAHDSMGHTPLDLACIWCRRKVARYLKNCIWKLEKKRELEERKLVQALYSDLVDMVKLYNVSKRTLIDEKMAEWANKKGLPHLRDFSPRVVVSKYHTQCLSSDQGSSNVKHAKHQPSDPREDQEITSSKLPPAPAPRPWSIYMGLQPEKPPAVPDLRDSVTVWRDGSSRKPQYNTKWDGTPHDAPDLPLDVLERALFPRAFPSRIVSPRHFEPQDIVEVQRRGCPQGRSTSPWTEVAMHLAEVLEPGHY